MSFEITLPARDGGLENYRLVNESSDFAASDQPFKSRICYSAAHVVADPFAGIDPISEAVIDWDATLQYRHHLWRCGLGVAEAMDTAQRGMGLDWKLARELIKRSIAEAASVGGLIACGAGTDHLNRQDYFTLDDVAAAYEEQISYVEKCGGRVILMASRALAKAAKTPEDYARIYGRILSQISQPVILHWLGEMFDPELAGYWGTDDLTEATEICLRIIEENSPKIDGIKISLLSATREIEMRRRLPANVKMYTGDDFNYDTLIKGEGKNFSHALLGIFDAIAPVASAAMRALDDSNLVLYDELFAPTVPLSRHIFQTPTRFYKTGIVFLAFLNGHQKHFRMIGGHESARNLLHMVKLFKLADEAKILRSAEVAVRRMKMFLAVNGVAQ